MIRLKPSVVVAAILLGFGACDSGTVREDESPDPIADEPRVLGVCFMEAEKCVSPYVDLGPYDDRQGKSETAIPVYVFPAVPPESGGRPHPADPDGLYNPYRLQNNVFADDGRVWAVWRVYSAELNLTAVTETGVQIWGEDADQSADFKSGNLRDLFADPFTSEHEILDAAEAGLIRVVNLFKNTDCPLVDPKPQDIIVNLNPSWPICD